MHSPTRSLVAVFAGLLSACSVAVMPVVPNDGADAPRDVATDTHSSPPNDVPADTLALPTDTPAVPTDAPQTPGTHSLVTVSGRQLLVRRRASDGSLSAPAPYDMKGVCWGPYGPNEPFESGGRNHSRFAVQDGTLMAAAHINTVRTYGAFERTPAGIAALDALYARGIMVAMTVFAAYDNTDAEDSVRYFRGHPAVLMWIVGNEWNYNKLYSTHTIEECTTKVNAAIAAIHALDPNHPVATVWGEIPAAADIARVRGVDLWGSNLYPWLDFGDRLTRWTTLSPGPLFVAEYGADAYRRNADGSGAEDATAQSDALQSLTLIIRMNLSANNAGVLVGGAPFEWNDEWWKSGAPAVHDTGGFANGGVYADRFANEEWWGLVDANRNPRRAYTTLTTLYQ